MLIETYIAAQALGLVFGPILQDLAKNAAKDFAGDFCKDSLKAVFGSDEGKKVAARALKEFLLAFDSELVSADLESEAERQSYTSDLNYFLKKGEVRRALGVVIEDEAAKVDHERLATLWAEEQLKATPGDFRWKAMCNLYQNKARAMLVEFPGFRDEINAVNAGKTAEATQRIAGLAPGFDTERYRQGLLDRYQNLKLESLESGGTIHNPIHLTKIFVEQNVRDCQQFNPRIHELPGDIKRALREKGVAGEELTAEEMEEMRRAFFGQAARGVVEALNDRDGRLFVVLGDPGSGKSVLLEYLALFWATAARSERESQPLPLLVELKAYARLREKHGSLLEYLHHATDGCGQLDQLDLHNHLQREGGLFLLDGLDEIFDEAVRASVVQEIANLTRSYAKARFVVSSRVIGYQQQTLSDSGFRHFMLQDLEPQQIADFIGRWHDLAYSDATDRNFKRNRLSVALERSPAIRELAGNPLLLTLMALLNRNQPLPDDRVDLYEQASRLLLHQWDAEKALPAGQTMALYHKQAMLRAVAYKMQTSEKGLAGNAISVQELEDTLTKYLDDEKFDKPREIADKLIKQLRGRNFILCFLGDDLYAFVHRTFLEYFCASAFIWEFKEKRTLTLEELQADTFDAHWQDEKWHEVLRLIAGQIAIGNPEFAGQLIESLLTKSVTDYNQALVLAAECFCEVRNRSALEKLDGKLMKKLLVLLRSKKASCGLREAALLQVVLCWPNLPSTRAVLKEIALSKDYLKLRQMALKEVAWHWRNEPGTLSVIRGIARSEKKSNMVVLALKLLADHWKGDPTTLSFIQEFARNDKDLTNQTAAMSLLARGWREAPETLTILKSCAQSAQFTGSRRSARLVLEEHWRADPAVQAWLNEQVDPEVQPWLAELK